MVHAKREQVTRRKVWSLRDAVGKYQYVGHLG